MKKIWYCVVETMEVPDDATDKEIDEILFEKLAKNREEPPQIICGLIRIISWTNHKNSIIMSSKLRTAFIKNY